MQPRRLATTLAAVLLAGTSLAASAASTRLSCDAFDDTDASLYARFVDGARTTFDVAVKIPAAAVSGTQPRVMPVFLGKRSVARMLLTRRSSGLWTGNLSLDSYAGTGAADDGAVPFPPSWPGVSAGTPVRVGRIGCTLQS